MPPVPFPSPLIGNGCGTGPALTHLRFLACRSQCERQLCRSAGRFSWLEIRGLKWSRRSEPRPQRGSWGGTGRPAHDPISRTGPVRRFHPRSTACGRPTFKNSPSQQHFKTLLAAFVLLLFKAIPKNSFRPHTLVQERKSMVATGTIFG